MHVKASSEIRAHSKILALVTPAVVMTVQPNFVDPVNLPKLLTLIAIVLTAMISSLVYLRKTKFTLSRIETAAVILATLFIISSWVSGLNGPSNVIRSLFGSPGRQNGLLYYTCLTLIVIMLLFFKANVKELSLFTKCFKLTAALLGGYMLLQYLDLDPIPWNRKALIGTMGNENFSSAALSCLTVFIFYHVVNSLSNVSNLNKLLYCLILAIMTFLVWKTNSLQGLIIICLGIAITTYSRIHSKLSKFKILIIIVVSFVLGLLLFVSFLGKGPFGSALAQYTLNLRLYYSSIGLRAMIENPIFGVGPDSYINGFKLYRDENFVSKYSINLLVDNAHSVPIQIGSGFGITTLIFYLALQLLIFSRSIKTLVDKNVTVEVKAWSLLFILLFLQSLLSIDNIGLGILQWTAGALVISHNQEYDEHKVNKFKNKVTNRKEMFNFPSVTLSILTISILFQGMGNQDQSWKNVFALDFKDGDSQWVKENFNKIGPVIKYESDRVERMLPNLHSADLDSEIRSMLIELVEKNPHDAKAFELLSKSQVVDGKTQGAITSLLAASDLDPMNYKLQLKIAELAKQIGDSKQERESLYKVIFRAPNGSDEYIQASEWLKELG